MPFTFAVLALISDVNADLDRALALYNDAYFGESLMVLDRLNNQNLTPTARIQSQLLVALNFLALGNEERAQRSFLQLLDLNPDFKLPEMTAPRVRAFFTRVREGHRVLPVIHHDPHGLTLKPVGKDTRAGGYSAGLDYLLLRQE